MMLDTYLTLACSLFDWGNGPGPVNVPGARVYDLYPMYEHDWDEVDSLYLDHETTGV